jgi:hypothetical protein
MSAPKQPQYLPRTNAPGYHTASASQAASMALVMARTRDANDRARIIPHLLTAISDLDKALARIGTLAHAAEKYDELLTLMAELGVTIPDPEEVLEIPEAGE